MSDVRQLRTIINYVTKNKTKNGKKGETILQGAVQYRKAIMLIMTIQFISHYRATYAKLIHQPQLEMVGTNWHDIDVNTASRTISSLDKERGKNYWAQFKDTYVMWPDSSLAALPVNPLSNVFTFYFSHLQNFPWYIFIHHLSFSKSFIHCQVTWPRYEHLSACHSYPRVCMPQSNFKQSPKWYQTSEQYHRILRMFFCNLWNAVKINEEEQ